MLPGDAALPPPSTPTSPGTIPTNRRFLFAIVTVTPFYAALFSFCTAAAPVGLDAFGKARISAVVACPVYRRCQYAHRGDATSHLTMSTETPQKTKTNTE
jgi:hypothetical protein